MLIFIDMLTSLGSAIGPEGILRLAFFLMLTKTDSSSQLFQNFRDQVGCLILKIPFIKLLIERLFFVLVDFKRVNLYRKKNIFIVVNPPMKVL